MFWTHPVQAPSRSVPPFPREAALTSACVVLSDIAVSIAHGSNGENLIEFWRSRTGEGSSGVGRGGWC
jgi:hypothetical protein